MNNLKLYTTLLFLFSITFIQAQEASQQSTVYFKDGSFLKGDVIATDEVGNIQLKLFTGQEISLSKDLIDFIRKQQKSQLILPSGQSLPTKGIYFAAQFHSLTSFKAKQEWQVIERRYGMGANAVLGYRFNTYFGMGLGAGFDGYGDYFVPIFLDFRGSFLKKRISPTYNLNIGYGIAAGGEEDLNNFDGFVVIKRKGGLMVYPSIGVRFASRKNATFTIDFGYKFQHLIKHREYDIDWWWDGNTYIDDIWYKSLAIRLGLEF